MSNRIDQLFKNKLHEYSLPPSEEAWTRIQSGASKKNNLVIYWRAAAVFVLMGLVVSSWYLFTSPVLISSQQISKTENTDIPERPALLKEDETESANAKTIEKQSSKTDQQKHLAKVEKSNVVNKEDAPLTESSESTTQLEFVELETTVTIAEVPHAKPIVIEFTLPTIVESTPTELAMATSETEKNSVIMKFLETARDVKNGDAALGTSLRGIKNELLAFDFKKEKTRRN